MVETITHVKISSMINHPEIKKILYITMSNLGDAVMGLPAFDYLRRQCPAARLTVVAAPRTKCLFESHPDVAELIVFDKHASLKEKIALYRKLKAGRFDVIVDLKNTFYRWGVKARYKNAALVRYPPWIRHFYEKHLYKAITALRPREVISEEEFRSCDCCRNPSFISRSDTDALLDLLRSCGLGSGDAFILFVPGARSDLKKWAAQNYREVICDVQRRYARKVVVAGDKTDALFAAEILSGVDAAVVNLCGRTTLGMLCALILRADLVVGSDSGALQIASYLGRRVVGVFGPTDPLKYGPWSPQGVAVRKNLLCAPCSSARCLSATSARAPGAQGGAACMKTVTPYDVLLAVRLLLEGREERFRDQARRRILLVRTDRIGDVVLSTPVIRALREFYPASFIAMMVSPQTRELVEGNPYLDQVFVFDRDRGHGGLWATLSFARSLARASFDTAIILHPTFRVHLVAFLAGIKERIGYDRKGAFFLTQTVSHRKQEGAKHEMEYNFDLLRAMGIQGAPQELYVPVSGEAQDFAADFLARLGVGERERLVAVNPAASCSSKLWPVEKFARLIDELNRGFGVRVLVVADAAHRGISEQLFNLVQTRPLDCSGRFTLAQLAGLFKRCELLVSNDSGPVHIAVALGTPVISIFGRNQPGLSPRRWGPVGALDVVLHKRTACSPCLAHACQKGFECLASISVEEVLENARRILGEKERRAGSR